MQKDMEPIKESEEEVKLLKEVYILHSKTR